jgi:hypothetical protein
MDSPQLQQARAEAKVLAGEAFVKANTFPAGCVARPQA